MFPERQHLEDIIHFVILLLPSQPAGNGTKHLLTSSQHFVQKRSVQTEGKGKVCFYRLWSKATKHKRTRMHLRAGSDWVYRWPHFTHFNISIDSIFYRIKSELIYLEFSQRTQALECVLCILWMVSQKSFNARELAWVIAGPPWSHAQAESRQ